MENVFLKYINENNRSIINISAEQDGDDLYYELEKLINTEKIICIDKCLSSSFKSQVIQKFIDKYKDFVEFVFMCNNLYENEKVYIKMGKIANTKNHDLGYKELVNSYNKKYYLEDCGGYDTFVETNGGKLPSRLQDVFNLVNPQKEDIILDVGCGRGELSYIIHLSGAKTIGIDYSKEAIGIANATYKDIIDSNLEYICQDVFSMNDNRHFNKIVMADIVEHIEQPMLEKLFRKLSQMITSDGILIIHTAPNKDYYDYTYPQKVKKAKEIGAYLPKNPRSYYEGLMHINEQNPCILEKSLRQTFDGVDVWTGGLNEIFKEKSYERSTEDNSIFALAGLSKEALEKHKFSYFAEPDSNNVGVEISSEIKIIEAKLGSTIIQNIYVKNTGNEILNSYGKYEVNLSYHIIDSYGNAVVFDGTRTKLEKLINPKMNTNTDVVISIPECLCVGERYIIRITIVAEGCFWFDNISPDFFCDINLDIV